MEKFSTEKIPNFPSKILPRQRIFNQKISRITPVLLRRTTGTPGTTRELSTKNHVDCVVVPQSILYPTHIKDMDADQADSSSVLCYISHGGSWGGSVYAELGRME
jgi:hypothetical protein